MFCRAAVVISEKTFVQTLPASSPPHPWPITAWIGPARQIVGFRNLQKLNDACVKNLFNCSTIQQALLLKHVLTPTSAIPPGHAPPGTLGLKVRGLYDQDGILKETGWGLDETEKERTERVKWKAGSGEMKFSWKWKTGRQTDTETENLFLLMQCKQLLGNKVISTHYDYCKRRRRGSLNRSSESKINIPFFHFVPIVLVEITLDSTLLQMFLPQLSQPCSSSSSHTFWSSFRDTEYLKKLSLNNL